MKKTARRSLMQTVPGPWHVTLLLRQLVAKNIHSLEYDPRVQYRFHQFFMYVWLAGMIIVWASGAFSDLSARLIMEVSVYANFATDFGSMSAALAAGNYHCQGCNCSEQKNSVDLDWDLVE